MQLLITANKNKDTNNKAGRDRWIMERIHRFFPFEFNGLKLAKSDLFTRFNRKVFSKNLKGEKIVKDRRRGFFFSFKKFGIFQDTTEDDKSFEKRCLNESENTKDISDKKFE